MIMVTFGSDINQFPEFLSQVDLLIQSLTHHYDVGCEFIDQLF